MVDEATKKTLAAIPLLKIRAGPRDKDQWVGRLKEEYMSLIKVKLITALWAIVICTPIIYLQIYTMVTMRSGTPFSRSIGELHYVVHTFYNN